ncbi:uncharacterized protein LOC125424147 [Ziziphus jujuba]|uniref:Uncharacterized protein LOC125424147 n=1 Tax=Ziziphus jujuba TaxID=326968 RepID=A0ABM3IWD1_ZIZJJ|nr:uncharacterized protein LOC107426288 [Ziziphus jujuba var. spinosa]XP_048336733.2 uncharacterized protein LOC125424147 [Ziziphus jujuba]
MDLVQSPSNGGTQGCSSDSDPLILAKDETFEDANTEAHRFSEDFDSTCSTPYVSAPSSPGRGCTTGYFFSAPASPMHFMLSSAPSASYSYSPSETVFPDASSSFEFEFSSRLNSNSSVAVGSMSSADELFMNGKIRPMKLSSHLQRPQILAPLLDLDVEEDDESEVEKCEGTVNRGRDLKLRSRSLHRKARSLSPLRNADIQWLKEDEEGCNDEKAKEAGDENILDLHGLETKQSETVSSETTPSCSASSSRSSSSGRNSKKWIFLKEILYRSKSEGRGNGKEKFWSTISFSTSKDKEKTQTPLPSQTTSDTQNQHQKTTKKKKQSKQASTRKGISGKPKNGVAKRKVPLSPHELHYTANRAQAEEMKKRTFLPYRQGLLGCLGFSSKGYGALNGLTRALNPVSSR